MGVVGLVGMRWGAGQGHKRRDCILYGADPATLDEIAYLDPSAYKNKSQENSEHIIHTTDGHAHKKTRTMHTENRCSARSHTDRHGARHISTHLSSHSHATLAPHPSLGAVSRTETRGATRCDARRMRPTCRALSLSASPPTTARFSLASLSLLSLSHGMGPAACEAGPGILSLARRLQGQPSAVAPPRRASPHPRRGQLSAAAICGPRRRLRPFHSAFRLS